MGCTRNEFTCGGSDVEKKCIMKSWLCDGSKDCTAGDDEAPQMCAQR